MSDDEEFEFEIDPEMQVEMQWADVEGERMLLMMVVDDLTDEGRLFHFDRDMALSMYEFLRQEFEEYIN